MSTRTDELRSRLERLLDQQKESLLRDSIRILQFETVSGGNPEQEAKYRREIPVCLLWLKELAQQMGFEFRQWDNKVAEIEWAEAPEPGERRPVMGIAAHIDVVTPAGKWKYPPFGGVVENGILYGRGTQDDKGPLIQALYAMYLAKEAGVVPRCDIRLIIGTKEETGDWSDIELYLKQRGAPDYSFTPDAEFPLITGEKGMINLEFTAEWAPVAPHAETGLDFILFKGGERSNIIPALAEITLRFPVEAKTEVMKELVRETTRFTVENAGSNITLLPNNEADSAGKGYYEAVVSFLGKAAHSSLPEKGHNAIADAARFFSDIETLPPPVRAFMQFLALISSEQGGAMLGIESEHPFVGKTTAALTLATVEKDKAMGLLNVRPTMGMPAQRVLELAREAAESFGEATGLVVKVEPRGGRVIDAIFLDPDKPGIGDFLAALRGGFEGVTDLPGTPMAIGGTTYAKALPNCCAFGPCLHGTDDELAHQADEHLAVASINRNTLIYALSIALMG
jgi:succinyl-diaminopimelate desuccinylase